MLRLYESFHTTIGIVSKTVLLELLAEDIPDVPRAVLYEEQDPLGIRPRAVKAKRARANLKEARCFDLRKTEDYLSIEEWTKDRGSWHAEPLWKKNFGPDENDKLIDFLIKKTRNKA